MRQLRKTEMCEKGCEYCEHMKDKTAKTHLCPFETCPYTELDGHASYIDYLKSNDMDFNYIMPRWLYEEGGAE